MDLRESPALEIVEQISLLEGIQVTVVEPNISELPASMERAAISSLSAALNDAHIVVKLVAHDEFSDLENLLGNDQLLFKATQ